MTALLHSLHNDYLSVSISNQGAELQSIKDAQEQEYLWQADPQFWARKAPVLFPIVGALKNDSYRFDDQEYALSQHGFARDNVFELIEATDTEAVYRLTDDKYTRELYPFEFVLDVIYRLEQQTLVVEYRVSNPSDKVLWFSIGGHPAFSLNWQKGSALSDYYLEFEHAESVQAALIEQGCLSEPSINAFVDGNLIPLSDQLFDRDALIFTEHSSRQVTLKHKTLEKSLSVRFEGFPHLGIWSKPNAPFVCIEPWQGHVDTQDHNQEFTEKAGIIALKPHQNYHASYSIRID
ncbi:aldose 1-epimerase family protein [Litoribrevibacter albus]|uniref:LACX protein n=1 Tax=Litoribrevibacter albus TaxID=1473156 RepID=A0AA37S846_9GAMM|nr:aldose 1-epimerase family protein [Litoribrevibacter albus]GLQ30004.1 LACX protein [Litoribrevibacter albus]